VRAIVEQHGGTVTAHSAGTGQGSVFIVRLPFPALNGGADAQRMDESRAPMRTTTTMYATPEMARSNPAAT
jgi:hypothetical protein